MSGMFAAELLVELVDADASGSSGTFGFARCLAAAGGAIPLSVTALAKLKEKD